MYPISHDVAPEEIRQIPSLIDCFFSVVQGIILAAQGFRNCYVDPHKSTSGTRLDRLISCGSSVISNAS